MGLDDLASTESAMVAAATAAVFSPRTRGVMRRGAVLGMAGALKVGDVVTGAARGVTRGVRGDATMPTPSGDGSPSATRSTRPTARRRASSASPRQTRSASGSPRPSSGSPRPSSGSPGSSSGSSGS